ncbi:hypothetical protein HYT56_05010 [Candidatus Woesearchaeota archaeon]|nr:hypothetical protein [Candidatus Woesearchaeota archaeon]
MSEGGYGPVVGGFPGNLRGYKLKRIHHTFQKLILWIIILLAIIWFVNKQILIDLYYWLLDYITNFS